jgi:hypothetical protein
MKFWIFVLLVVIQFSFQNESNVVLNEFKGNIFKHESSQCSLKKSRKTVLILSLFVGCLGVDKLYLGFPWMAIANFLTFGCFGVWYLIDLIFLWLNLTKDSHGCDLI